MKISGEVVEAMRERIAPFDHEGNRDRYRRGDFPRAEVTNDLNMRYRWDLFWAAKGREVLPDDVNSDHIDTALRRIVRPLI